MNSFINSVTGVFTVHIDGKKHANLVVNQGLSNIYTSTGIGSLCDTLKVYNHDGEVTATDTSDSYGGEVASSSNITSSTTGISSDANSEYFYLRKTWTFTKGQIYGVINKLAVFSDNGEMYAAALLKDEDGNVAPVRPLYAPKVEITYESRWHFKQGEDFTDGKLVNFGDAGYVIVKSNLANKNDPLSYENLDKPFAITGVALYSDEITNNDSAPVNKLFDVDTEDYTVEYVDGEEGVYGQKLKIVLPRDKYINDTPIATVVVTTTRGQWQMGFDGPLEKPTLSKREISLTFPFFHGTVNESGDIEPNGDPDALDSIFDNSINANYNISIYSLEYDNAGTVNDKKAFFGVMEEEGEQRTLNIPDTGVATLLFGESADPSTYLDDAVEGIMLKLNPGGEITGMIDGKELDYVEAEPEQGVQSVEGEEGSSEASESTGETEEGTTEESTDTQPEGNTEGSENTEGTEGSESGEGSETTDPADENSESEPSEGDSESEEPDNGEPTDENADPDNGEPTDQTGDTDNTDENTEDNDNADPDNTEEPAEPEEKEPLIIFNYGDTVKVTVADGAVTLLNETTGESYTTRKAESFDALPTYSLYGVTEAEDGSRLEIY